MDKLRLRPPTKEERALGYMSFVAKWLDLNEIRVDKELQPRVELSQELIEEYARAMSVSPGAKFPPVEVIYDGTDHWLWDGFHRYLAAEAAGQTRIWTRITSGTRQDALWQCLSANATHGQRRTNEDIANAARKALRLKPNESARLLANHVGVSDHTIEKYRNELIATGEIPQLTQRTGADGKERRSPVMRILPRLPTAQVAQLAIDRPAANNAELGKQDPKTSNVLGAMSKAGDVAGVYHMVSYLRRMVMRGHDAGHPVYRFLNTDQFGQGMDYVMESLNEIVPAEVCGSCKGEGCPECRSRGWVGRAAWERKSALNKQLMASTDVTDTMQQT